MNEQREPMLPTSTEPHQIGIVGSPSTTSELTIDIIDDAIQEAVLGDLVYTTHAIADGEYFLALGTVGEIETRNRWHEDPNMRGVLRVHGELPHLSGDGDVRTAKVTVQAVYRTPSAQPPFATPPTEEGGALGMSPTTGKAVYRVDDDAIQGLIERHKDSVVYLGHIYRNKVLLPMFIRDFDDPAIDGAFHTGIFGRTGSGKTALASHVMMLQMRHPKMGMIVFDPQGQFTDEEKIPIKLGNGAVSLGREVKKLSVVEGLQLRKDAPLLVDLLAKTHFLRQLSIKPPSYESACDELVSLLQATEKWEEQTADALLRDLLQRLVDDDNAMKRLFATKLPRDRVSGAITHILGSATAFATLVDHFSPVHSLFSPRRPDGGRRESLGGLIRSAIDPDVAIKPYIVIDLSAPAAYSWLESDDVKARIIHTIVQQLRRQADELWRTRRKTANCAVVFDEGQRFASSGQVSDGAERLADFLVGAVRETRKVGIGWMFITQQIGSLRPAITAQLTVRAYGYGLTTGTDLVALKDDVGGGGALDLYRSFASPSSRSDRPSYPFMITGPISPLSFTAAPVFLDVFTDKAHFARVNHLMP